MAFFGKVWRGEYSLARTYWLFGVVVGIVYNVMLNLAVVATGELGTGFFLMILYLPWYVVLTGGVWRSANIYCATEGKNSLWGRLAQIAVVLGWAVTLFSIADMAEGM
ncbi:MAG: hypothetical protein V3U44_04425 [Alphaproteobacteria bacterium]